MLLQRTFLLLPIVFLISTKLPGQDSSLTKKIICFTPTKAGQVNGIALGIWNHPGVAQQKFNGLNLEILGSGWITPFLGLDDGGYTKNRNQTINGLSLGITLFNGQMNGFSISPTINTTLGCNGLKIGLLNFDLYKSNGLQIGSVNLNNENCGVVIGVFNKAKKMRGIQFGLINKSDELHGYQIGLININDSRTLPFINWATRKKN